jgi:hypothetical protein
LNIRPVRSRLDRRRREREDEAFWNVVRSRRREVTARLAAWDEADAHAREEYVREQERLADAMLARSRRGWSPGMTRDERAELGLELSPAEREQLRLLMPFFAGPPTTSAHEVPASNQDDHS